MKVLILKGEHSGREVIHTTFEYVRGPSVGKFGRFLLVNGTGVPGYAERNFKVFIKDEGDYRIIGDNGEIQVMPVTVENEPPEPPRQETDEEIKERMAERFRVLDQLVRAIAMGKIKGLVVSGASGVGKSHGVEAALEFDETEMLTKLARDGKEIPDWTNDVEVKRKTPYELVSGYVTPPSLYKLLYDNSQKGKVVVFDDCDSVLLDDTSLNLLKVALNTTGKRVMSWMSERRDDLPNRFEYHGSIIFISNLNFEKMIKDNRTKLVPHLEAIISRCLYLDLTITTVREKLLRIEQVAVDQGMLRERMKLEEEAVDDVMTYLRAHYERFQELSLRKVQHLAELRQISGMWQKLADATLLKAK